MRIRAYICSYNEADIIGWVIGHLISQGVEVFLLDNWSTDQTWDIAHSFPLAGSEWFPSSGPTGVYEWERMLGRVGELSQASGADWCSLHDADEIRRSPFLGTTLAEGIARVDSEGYTAINHQCFNFQPVDNGYSGDPEGYFRHYVTEFKGGDRIQVKTWKNLRGSKPICGGHMVNFPGVRISPDMFILKHYPIRSQHHGETKVFQWRRPRWSPSEKARNWHVQYDNVRPGHNFLARPEALKHWPDPVEAVPVAIPSCTPDEVARMRRMWNLR